MHCLCNCPHHTTEVEAMDVSARQFKFPQTPEISRAASTVRANYSFCLSSATIESRDQNGNRNLLPHQEKPRQRSERRPLHFIILESAILVLAATTLGLASAYGAELLRAPTLGQVLLSHSIPHPLFPNDGTTLNGIHNKVAVPAATEGHLNTSPKADREYWVVFYSGTMPFFSIIFALLGLYLCFARKLASRYCVAVSVTLLIGWCIMLGWWVACDFGVPFGNRSEAPKSCYQHQLIPTDGGLMGISTALMNAKICFGITMLTVYGIYLSASILCPVEDSRRSKEDASKIYVPWV